MECLLGWEGFATKNNDRAFLEFEGMRFRLGTETRAERAEPLRRMTALLEEETEQDYIYTPDHIEHKVKLIDVTLKQQIPGYRKRHGL